MNWEFIHRFLDALDGAANANAFWLELAVPEKPMPLDALLVQHLRSGNLHFELVKQDIVRDWNNYVEIVFPRNGELPVVLPKPGNVWNGRDHLHIQPIPADRVEALLMDLLTGQKRFFTRSTSGSPLDWENASSLVEGLLEMLANNDPDWTAFQIEPNFLNTVDDQYNSDWIRLGYFEGRGRDLALVFRVDGELYMLLTNGYG